MGIEPTSSAWKAEVLPLNYTRSLPGRPPRRAYTWWRGEDSNLRRLSRQIYSLIPLATREPLHEARYSPSTINWLSTFFEPLPEMYPGRHWRWLGKGFPLLQRQSWGKWERIH